MLREVHLVNRLVLNMKLDQVDVTSVNRLLYASSFVVSERLELMKKRRETLKSRKPWWQRRLEASILQWRKDLGRLNEFKNGVSLKSRIMNELNRRYDVTNRDIRAVWVFLENKIKTAATKIKFFKESKVTLHQNKLFESNPSYLYKELGGKKNHCVKPPDANQTKEFWSSLWSQRSDFNHEATWLKDFEESHKIQDIVPQKDIVIDECDVRNGIKRMANWKAPGPDGVRGF